MKSSKRILTRLKNQVEQDIEALKQLNTATENVKNC
jgi:hypothetical protein